MKQLSSPRPSSPFLVLTCLPALLSTTGCLTSEHGVLAADRMGDVSNPVAVRALATEALRSACPADGVISAEGLICSR